MSSHPHRPSLESLEPRLLMSAASHAPELWLYGATVSANSLTTETPTDTPAVTLDWAARIRNTDSAPIAIDSAGNTFIAGRQIIKISPSGDQLWAIDFWEVTGATTSDIALDHDGNLLITGRIYGPAPVSGGFDTTYDSTRTGFVFKLDPDGNHLWSTYLHGQGAAIAIDNQGNILVTGLSYSSGWAQLGYDTSFGGGSDAFVIKLSPAGDHLWSTYLGGTEYEGGNDIAADNQGSILVTGYTGSPNWVAGGYDLSLDGTQDAFVAKLSTTGAHLWSTYHGDARNDSGDALAIDHDSNIVVAGDIRFLVPYEPGYGQVKYDPFVLKLNSAGQKLWDKTFGGSEDEYVSDVAIDTANNILIVGSTRSGDWTANGLDNTFGGRSDAYVLKLNSLGSTLWSTYLGSDLTESGRAIALDPHGGIIVLGTTHNFPDLIAIEPLPGGGGGMYTGDSYNDISLEIVVQSLAFAPPANIQSSLTDYQGAFSPSGNNNIDVFLLRLTEPSTIPCPADFNLDGQVNVQDINPFILAMTNLPAYQQQYPDAVLALIDPNADGLINAQDLNAFVAHLTPQPVPFTGGANLFDEAFYLQHNPDVAALVGPGNTYATARDHFTAVGQSEGRQPNPFFNESFYLAQNPDVAIAVAQGHFSSGFEHFARHGQTEARDFSKLFDERFYLAMNPDVASGVAANLWRSGFEHFIVQGHLESRSIIPLFDEQTYLTNNPDVAADTGPAPGKTWSTGFDHFLAVGQFESRRFSPYYFETAYLLNNPDVAANVGPGKLFATGLHHYILFGQFEGRLAV